MSSALPQELLADERVVLGVMSSMMQRKLKVVFNLPQHRLVYCYNDTDYCRRRFERDRYFVIQTTDVVPRNIKVQQCERSSRVDVTTCIHTLHVSTPNSVPFTDEKSSLLL